MFRNMYAGIFTDLHFAEILQRIETLSSDSNRQWGTMTPAQMLRHCRGQIEFILNPKEDVKVYKTMFRFAPVRWFALYGFRWPKNAATAPEMDVNKGLRDTTEFNEEKKLLFENLQTLYHTTNVDAVHPLFGRMGKDKWGRVVWKHLDHHLRQFGC